MEKWKDIPLYKGLYQVSNLGNVLSLNYNKTGKYKLLLLGKSVGGYLQVVLSNKGTKKRYLVSRLVGQAFLGLDINNTKMLVCHKDDNPLNNQNNNLFLGTHKDNTQDMLHKGRNSSPMLGKLGKLCPHSKGIRQFSLTGEFIRNWDSMADVQRELSINTGGVCYNCKGKQKTAGGFIWRYA